MHSEQLQRVGIYSGAFDPVHQGHIDFAKEALSKAKLSKVFFLVEPRPRHKQGVKAFEHRLAMVKLAIRNEPNLGVIVLDQPRFNIPETWPQLEARFADAELVMLLGDDVFRRLSHWPYLNDLASSTSFVVGLRHATEPDVADYIKTLEKSRHVHVKYMTFATESHHIASRTIRHELRQGKVPEGVDRAVVRYIHNHELYSASNE